MARFWDTWHRRTVRRFSHGSKSKTLGTRNVGLPDVDPKLCNSPFDLPQSLSTSDPDPRVENDGLPTVLKYCQRDQHPIPLGYQVRLSCVGV